MRSEPTLDGRLGNADLVNALTDDFEALLESGVETVVEARLGQGQAHLVVGRGDIDVVDRSAETAGVDLRDQGAQCSFRPGTLIGIRNGDDNGVANCADRLRLDTLGAQLAAGIVEQGPQTVLFQTSGIDFKHEIGAAAQVETERDLTLREPGRHRVKVLLGKKVGQGDDNADHNDQAIQRNHPFRSTHGLRFRLVRPNCHLLSGGAGFVYYGR